MVDITYIKELENELLFHMITFTEIWPLTLKGHIFTLDEISLLKQGNKLFLQKYHLVPFHSVFSSYPQG